MVDQQQWKLGSIPGSVGLIFFASLCTRRQGSVVVSYASYFFLLLELLLFMFFCCGGVTDIFLYFLCAFCKN